MATSHYNNSTASREAYEPVNQAQFRCNIQMPSLIKPEPLFIEHVVSISGLDGLYPSVGVIEQKFMQSSRSYAGKTDSTYMDLNFAMTLNLNNVHENYIYNSIRRWYSLIHDPATGAESCKKDYKGSALIEQWDRDGSIWRKVAIKVCFPTGQPTGLGDLNIGSGNEAAQISFTLRCDLFTDANKGLY